MSKEDVTTAEPAAAIWQLAVCFTVNRDSNSFQSCSREEYLLHGAHFPVVHERILGVDVCPGRVQDRLCLGQKHFP